MIFRCWYSAYEHCWQELDPFQKRQDASSTTIGVGIFADVENKGYYVEVTAGTPPQTQQVHIDTGSSDTWFISTDNTQDPAPRHEVPSGVTPGKFDINKSTSTNATGFHSGGFKIIYGDDTEAIGDYFQDILTIGGVSLSNMQLGLAHETNSSTGRLGLGSANEASASAAFQVANNSLYQYPNLLDTMADQNSIATQAYSLWLNDIESRNGSILFGGIDTTKYHGNLTILQLYPTPGSNTTEVIAFYVSLTSMSITTDSGTSNVTPPDFPAIAAVLDSGSSILSLPEQVVQSIYEITGAVFFNGTPAAFVPCSARNIQGTFDFGFGGPNGPIIKVPIAQMILYPIEESDKELYPGTNDTECVLGINPVPPGALIILGDTFVRSTYILYDLANSVVGIAETNFNATGESIVPFASSKAQIPNATSVNDETTPTAVTPALATYSPMNTLPIFNGSAASVFAGNFASLTASGTSSPSATAATTSNTGSSTSKPNAGSSMKPLARENLVLMALTTVFFALGGLLLV